MYQETKPMFSGAATCIKRIADNAFIPFDDANTDFVEYKKWLEAGNAPIGADTPLPSDSVADETLSTNP